MKHAFLAFATLLCLAVETFAVVVFHDTFTGSAGPLEGRTPDINPSGGTWTYSNGSLTQPQKDLVYNLDGNGNVYFPLAIATTMFIDIEPGDVTNKLVTLTVTLDIVGNDGTWLFGFGNDSFRGIDQRSVGPVLAATSGASLTVFNPGGIDFGAAAFDANPVLNQVNDFSTFSIAIDTSNSTFTVTGDHDDPSFQSFTGSYDPSAIYTLFEDAGPSGLVEFDFFYMQYNGSGTPLLSEIVIDVSDIPAALYGDYNDNGTVDAADYTVWRDNENTAFPLPNEDPSATPGQVTAEDYTVWAANYGTSTASVPAAVPEPTVLILAASLGLCAAVHRGQVSR